MKIQRVKLRGFRNLENCEVEFCPGKNLIFGRNGAGKTSILEGIFLLTYGKSFLTRKKNEIINRDVDQFILNMSAANVLEGMSVTIAASYGERFNLFLNDKKSNIFEINRYLYPVIFSSSDYHQYIANRPYTRKMMDRFIFGMDPLYIKYLLSYNKALKQKNHLLKSSRNVPEIRSWNKTIGELAEKIVGIKTMFLSRLNDEVEKKFNRGLTIRYKPSLKLENGVSGASFYDQFDARVSAELKYQRTLVGPHLDGFEMMLDSKPLKIYSSGEKKIHLLMFYIAFIELFKEQKKEYPVFLVDDFDTAIDSGNIDFLMENYPEMQVVATSVNRNSNFEKLIELKKEK
jgi:DNA replication and repair protein RecF